MRHRRGRRAKAPVVDTSRDKRNVGEVLEGRADEGSRDDAVLYNARSVMRLDAGRDGTMQAAMVSGTVARKRDDADD